MIQAVADFGADTYIVATDRGIFHKMQEAAPHATFLEAPSAGASATCKSCAHCPWMAMNGVSNLVATLKAGSNEIQVDPATGRQAMVPLKRMLDFNEERKRRLQGD
jgi:quinolinate synthase